MRLIDADKLPISFDGHTVSVWKKDLDAAPTVNPYEWISVEDRLPSDESKVLCWYEYFRYGDYNCMCQTYGIGFYDMFYKRWSGDAAFGHKARVLAWMPLPAPPIGKENKNEDN